MDSILGSAARAKPAKPTIASAKKVMDSLVRAEVAAELRNNPEMAAVSAAPEKKISTPAVKVAHTPVKVTAKTTHKPVNGAHKPVKITPKPVNAATKTVKDKVIAKPIKNTHKTVIKPAAP